MPSEPAAGEWGAARKASRARLPLVLVYQAWTYWVFRRRLTVDSIPTAHSVVPATVLRLVTGRKA